MKKIGLVLLLASLAWSKNAMKVAALTQQIEVNTPTEISLVSPLLVASQKDGQLVFDFVRLAATLCDKTHVLGIA